VPQANINSQYDGIHFEIHNFSD